MSTPSPNRHLALVISTLGVALLTGIALRLAAGNPGLVVLIVLGALVAAGVPW